MNPIISVLMTSYNREKYIGASIESILAQTFDDFELLVVDDHSIDHSAEIARTYAKRDARVRVVVNESTLGQFGNRNRAAQLAAGLFLKYHDSDDLMYPHCLATMLAPLAAEPRAGFALSMGWCWPGGPCPMLLSPRLCYQREFLGLGMFMCGPASALFRTAVFRDLGGFPDMGVGSDHLFWLRACTRVNALLLPADLFWYRSHPDQAYRSATAAAEYTVVAGAAWRALQSPECPLEPTEREQAKRNWAYGIAKNLYRDLRAGRWSVARMRLRQTDMSWRDWLRYLRPPRRSAAAGTPLEASGEYVIPDWSCYRIPDDAIVAVADQHGGDGSDGLAI